MTPPLQVSEGTGRGISTEDGDPSALIFDVQRFSLHDGPGIRTTVFFKGCPLRCAWCQNPESFAPRPEVLFRLDRCERDGACQLACPLEAISMDGADPVARDRCDGCGACAERCDYGAFSLVGRRVGLEQLLQEVSRDAAYYRSSGGGVTLSGGEPTSQMDFLGAFVRRCRQQDVTVVLQTSGAFKWESFEPHLRFFELIHFDLKVIDPARHRELTGADNRTILQNARRLVARGAPVLFRTPVVPGLTDTSDSLRGLGDFLSELGVGRVQLLGYHAMGEAKLPRLGYPIAPLQLDARARSGPALEQARQVLRQRGLEVCE